jgi:surfeit locus 1 family protein
VQVSGTFLNDRETLVQASTDLGSGYWVMTPLRQADGSIVLVNRGFVPPEQRERATRAGTEPTGQTTVTGLLRVSEPGTRFLRKNDAAKGIWYARDVQAIAAARGLGQVAPYFIDAEAAPAAPGAAPTYPAGGLTVIAFPNNHLVYALTWYGLALMLVGGVWLVVREERRLRCDARGSATPGNGGKPSHR